MKKLLSIALTICFCSTCIFNKGIAQIKQIDIPASILLNNGEQVLGFIKNDVLAKMSKSVQFRTLSEKDFSTYNLTDFKQIQIDNKEIYHVLKCNSTKDTTQINVLGIMILKGGVSVYEVSNDGVEVYIIEKNKDYYWLQDDVLKDFDTEMTRYFFKNVLYNVVKDGGITDEEIKNIFFNRDKILAVITKYNQNKNYKSEVLTYKLKKKSYLIAGISANPLDRNDYEVLANISYRFYIPRFSKTTSVNFALQYNYIESKIYYTDVQNKPQVLNPIISGIFLPIFVQQNILNKSVRPYLRAGVSLTYFQEKNSNVNNNYTEGFQRNYGIGLLGGLGVEMDLYKGLMFKSDAYIDALKHLVTAGFAYRYSLN